MSVRDTSTMTMLVAPRCVHMDTIPTTRMPALPTATMALDGLSVECLLAPVLGITGAMLDIGVEEDTGVIQATGTMAPTEGATLEDTDTVTCAGTTDELMSVIMATETPGAAMPEAGTVVAGVSTAAVTDNSTTRA